MINFSMDFLTAYQGTKGNEGGYSADKLDPGGQTFMGISRVYWPNWIGWPVIDRWLKDGGNPPDLIDEVYLFYWMNFWQECKCQQIAAISKITAYKVFDMAVNLGTSTAIKYLQDALSLLNRNQELYHDLTIDGKIGPRTLGALDNLVHCRRLPVKRNEKMLLNTLMILQGSKYIDTFRKNPEKEKYVGWILRAGMYTDCLSI